MKLLPYPRSLKRLSGTFILPDRATLQLDAGIAELAILKGVAARLSQAVAKSGVKFTTTIVSQKSSLPCVSIFASAASLKRPGSYSLEIDSKGVRLGCRDEAGLHAGVATVRQLFREHGHRLPFIKIRDFPDFPRRGVMLDISRGRVPRLETLMELAGHLADFKINELQLYTEHTFAYCDYKAVWRNWAPLTSAQIKKLDTHCRVLGIDLVPNQNSFGHLREFLTYRPLRKLAEIPEPWPDGGGAFLRYPSTLAPNHPGTLPFLHGLYDELLPNFTSKRFNVGCDETWDLGRGQSKALCDKLGKGRVYLDFLKKIHHECHARGKQMMFWGDIILQHPELVRDLPRDAIALNWGYEADHPFETEARMFAKSKVPFYVCPGTSTWQTLLGKHDNAFPNLRRAALAGRKHGAQGYLITDWGDGGHPQPLAVSYLPYMYGASMSWCAKSFDDALQSPSSNGLLEAVLDRDIFKDKARVTTQAAYSLGIAHRKLNYFTPNATPLGATIAAPPSERREIFCRDGLKYYARIPAANIRIARQEIEKQRKLLHKAKPTTPAGKLLNEELDLAARMAIQSCQFMLWQQLWASGKIAAAHQHARKAIAELKKLQNDFKKHWPKRNQGIPLKNWPCLGWRIHDYHKQSLAFTSATARK